MSRLLFAGLLFAGLAFGIASQALAFDYDEPVVPSQFLVGPPEPAAAPARGGLTLLRRQDTDLPRLAPVVASVPAPSRLPAYGWYACVDGSGRAVWTYNAC